MEKPYPPSSLLELSDLSGFGTRFLERVLAMVLFMPLMLIGGWLGFEIPGVDHSIRTAFFISWMITRGFVVDRICKWVFRKK